MLMCMWKTKNRNICCKSILMLIDTFLNRSRIHCESQFNGFDDPLNVSATFNTTFRTVAVCAEEQFHQINVNTNLNLDASRYSIDYIGSVIFNINNHFIIQ